MKTYDIVVVGAGVVGCGIARALSSYEAEICVLERNADVCEGTSKANSAIIHSGYDPMPGTWKARLNVRGNQMMDTISRELDVPFQRIGAFVLCFDSDGVPKLRELLERGIKNGVPGLRLLTREELLSAEPNIGDQVHAALYAPTSGVVCPFELTMGFAENASENGVEFLLNTKVEALRRTEGGFILDAGNGEIFCRALVNAAGLYADTLHNALCKDQITIKARAGEYLLLDRAADGHVSHTIFQLPNELGKGILVTPTVHGNLLMGPTSADLADKEATRTTAEGMARVEKTAALSIKNLPLRQVITSFTGLRAHREAEDFYIGESVPGFFEAVGIDSPGLSAAPAIGEEISIRAAAYLKLKPNGNFNPKRRRVRNIASLPVEERAAAIAENPAYGTIVCRCEEVSEGEILDAIHRPLGAKTLDGVKRRTRAGMGRCQAGFCSPRVMELLARELDCSMLNIAKNEPGSEILYKETREGGNAP